MSLPAGLLFAPILLAVAACSGDASNSALVTIDTLPGGILSTTTSEPTERGEWTLVHERDVQPAGGSPGELISPESVALADDGTLYVAESDPPTINVYSPTGTWLRSIGRSGAGPGEFTTGYIALRGDSLILHDPQQSRSTVYDATTGEVLSIRTTTCCYYSPIGVDGTGHAWVRSIEQVDTARGPGQSYVRFPIGGTTADTVTVPQNPTSADQPRWNVRSADGAMQFSTSVPLTPAPIEAIDPTRGLVTGFGTEYRLRRTTDGVDTVALFGRPMPAVAVMGDEKTALVDARVAAQLRPDGRLDEITLRKAFDGGMIPDTRPAFEAVIVDGAGRTFVRRSLPDTMAVHFDLFGVGGVWLDELTLANPGWARNAYLPTSFATDHIAIADEDADGLPIIRIYRLTHTK